MKALFAPSTVSIQDRNILFFEAGTPTLQNNPRNGLVALRSQGPKLVMAFESEPDLEFSVAYSNLMELLIGHQNALKDIQVQWVYESSSKKFKLVNLSTLKGTVETIDNQHNATTRVFKVHPSEFKVGYTYRSARVSGLHWCTSSSAERAVLLSCEGFKTLITVIDNLNLDSQLVAQWQEAGEDLDFNHRLMTRITQYTFKLAYANRTLTKPRATLPGEVEITSAYSKVPLTALRSDNLLAPWKFVPAGNEDRPYNLVMNTLISTVQPGGSTQKAAALSIVFNYQQASKAATLQVALSLLGAYAAYQIPEQVLYTKHTINQASLFEAFNNAVELLVLDVQKALRLPQDIALADNLLIDMFLYEMPCDDITFTVPLKVNTHLNPQGVRTYIIPTL